MNYHFVSDAIAGSVLGALSPHTRGIPRSFKNGLRERCYLIQSVRARWPFSTLRFSIFSRVGVRALIAVAVLRVLGSPWLPLAMGSKDWVVLENCRLITNPGQ